MKVLFLSTELRTIHDTFVCMCDSQVSVRVRLARDIPSKLAQHLHIDARKNYFTIYKGD